MTFIKPNGATAGNEAEYGDEDDEGDGDDDDDDDDDDEDDDEYVEEDDEDNTAHPIPLNKKRSIDEVVDKEASQGSKKIKAWQSKPPSPGALPPCYLPA